MVENIIYKNQVLAIIVRNSSSNEYGIKFFTPSDYSQQLAYMHYPKGKAIEPHVHNMIERQIHYTKEVLFIKRGKLKVDFYNDEKEYIKSAVISAGDVILLATGGHGFEILEELEMFEVKQGPYSGDHDKTRFVPKMASEKQ